MGNGGFFGWAGDKVGEFAEDAFNSAMKALWNASIEILKAVFGFIDRYTTPQVSGDNSAYLGLLPMTIWIGLVVLIAMTFVQIGKAVLAGGRGFARILIGLVQYAFITASGLGILAAMVEATNALTTAILKSANLSNWEGLAGRSSAWADGVQGLSGVVLGLVALLLVIPASLGFAIEAVARFAGILILGATIAILAAGLVSESAKQMFWTGLRWMLALLFMTPATAFAVVIGENLAIAAAGGHGQNTDAGHAIAGALVSGIVLIIALACPMALFKLFAFVDPNSLSGAGVRAFVSGGGSGGRSAQGGSADSSEGGAEEAGEGRFAQAMSALGPVGAAMGALSSMGPDLAAKGSGILDVAGAGHPGGPDSQNGSSKGRSGGDPSKSGDDNNNEPGDAGDSGAGPSADSGSGAVADDGGSPSTAGGSAGTAPAGESSAPVPAPAGGSASEPSAGSPAAPPQVPDGGGEPPAAGGGGGSAGGSGGSAGAAGAAETAAVAL
ncbi:hypothetical protein Acy02nite_12850 [Actinoplanes cyaneus]|uniref:TrbL/VirB6 plasmid conjugal transfer protein n=1 Tax=Actinoplanes cyaneus TaxID=52696 RepID=A0A919ID66_9ACTN|nr:hypothetical protein [Actinoplanes cyaneus]MCW2137352.1 hypothetical protein [Actinoplanes cyaneus]GID63404.1 hypothetical protein Acy02nite_12850 [Actinoplanes cyaneus]